MLNYHMFSFRLQASLTSHYQLVIQQLSKAETTVALSCNVACCSDCRQLCLHVYAYV